MKKVFHFLVNNYIPKGEFYSILSGEFSDILFETLVENETLYFTRRLKNTNNPVQFRYELFKFLRKGYIQLKSNEKDKYIEFYIDTGFILKTASLLTLVFFILLKYFLEITYFYAILGSTIFFCLYYCIGFLNAYFQIKRIINYSITLARRNM